MRLQGRELKKCRSIAWSPKSDLPPHPFTLSHFAELHAELQEVRRWLRDCYEKIDGFLLPDPGKRVKKPDFTGSISEVSLVQMSDWQISHSQGSGGHQTTAVRSLRLCRTMAPLIFLIFSLPNPTAGD